MVLILFVVFIVKTFEDIFHLKKEDEKGNKKGKQDPYFEETKHELIKQQAEIQKNRDKLAIDAKLEKKLLENKPT